MIHFVLLFYDKETLLCYSMKLYCSRVIHGGTGRGAVYEKSYTMAWGEKEAFCFKSTNLQINWVGHLLGAKGNLLHEDTNWLDLQKNALYALNGLKDEESHRHYCVNTAITEIICPPCSRVNSSR